jgi:hypothetical protein
VGQSIQVTSRVRARDEEYSFEELAAEGRERERHEERVGIGPAQMAMGPERLDDAKKRQDHGRVPQISSRQQGHERDEEGVGQ